jgi:hypothetical protein
MKPAHDQLKQLGLDETFVHNGHLKVFNHHVYEYRKGLRSLALQTLPFEHESWVTSRLKRLGIDYLIYHAGSRNINVFLGDSACLQVIRQIGKFDLRRYTPEEDFMLGIMLGYGRRQQCQRYLAMVRQTGRDPHCSSNDHDPLCGDRAQIEKNEVYS